MNILADESVDYRIIYYLRLQSFSVFAVIDNDAAISDSEVLKKANEQNALLITEDKDFGELVFRLKLKHKGIILLRFRHSTIEDQNEKVLETLQKYYQQLLNNFSVLSDKRLRIRRSIS